MKEIDEILQEYSDELDYVTENPEDSHGKAEFFDRPNNQAKSALKQLLLSKIPEKNTHTRTAQAHHYDVDKPIPECCARVEGYNQCRQEVIDIIEGMFDVKE